MRFENGSLIGFWSQLDCCPRTFFAAHQYLPWVIRKQQVRTIFLVLSLRIHGDVQIALCFLWFSPVLDLHEAEDSLHPLSLVFWLRLPTLTPWSRGSTQRPDQWGHFPECTTPKVQSSSDTGGATAIYSKEPSTAAPEEIFIWYPANVSGMHPMLFLQGSPQPWPPGAQGLGAPRTAAVALGMQRWR